MESSFTIKAIAQETGVSVHTIRAWEKRYGALAPLRSDTNRRRYSQKDVDRLRSLDRAVQAGHSIGAIATLADKQLAQLIHGATSDLPEIGPSEVVEECMNLIRGLHAAELGATLRAAADRYGVVALVTDVLAPITEHVGEGWHRGEISISQEHVSTAVIRGVLDQIRLGFVSRRSAPTLVSTTPPNQMHELGSMMIATVAASAGWRSVYLGANMPWSDIQESLQGTKARALALSIVMPMNAKERAAMSSFMTRLDPGVTVFIGGRCASELADATPSTNGILLSSITQLATSLEALKASLAKK